MDLRISEKAKSVRDLFIHGKLEECMNLASQFDPEDEDFNSYQYSQIYKGLSYEELSQEIEGYEFFLSLIELSKSKKGNRVDAIDVIMYSLHQWANLDHNNELAYSANPKLLDSLKEYHLQNHEKEDYNECLYKFGMSMYQFIANLDDIEYDEEGATLEVIKCVDKINYLKEEVLFLVGWQFDCIDDYARALKWYGLMEKENHFFPGILNNIAYAYLNSNDNKNAEKYFLKSLEVCPNNAMTLHNLAAVYERTEQKEKVIYYYEKALKTNPTHIKTYNLYANYLNSCNSFEVAKQVLLKGLEYPIIYTPILSILIKYAIQKDNLNEALEYLNKQISADPENGIFEFNYALLLVDFEDEISLEFFQRCLKKSLPPSKIKAANSKIAYIYSQLDNNEELLSQVLYTCGLDIEDDYDDEFGCIADYFNSQSFISTKEKINIVESLKGRILTRLDQIIDLIQDQLIKSLFQYKLDLYVNTLNFVAYQKFIQPQLTFQSEYAHWDLFLD